MEQFLGQLHRQLFIVFVTVFIVFADIYFLYCVACAMVQCCSCPVLGIAGQGDPGFWTHLWVSYPGIRTHLAIIQ